MSPPGTGTFRRPKKIRWPHIVLLAAGVGFALSTEFSELTGWGDLEHPSHMADIITAVCGTLIAWCARFVEID